MNAVIVVLVLVVLLLLLCVIMVAQVLNMISAVIADAPFVPTKSTVLDTIVKEMGLTNQSVLYELGCGDARMLATAAALFPQLRGVGVDIGPVPYLLAKFRTRSLPNIKIRRENVFTTKLADATHIYLYLYPHVISALMPSIVNQCKSGMIIASCDFEIKGYEPFRVVPLPNDGSKLSKRLLLYRV
jgi:hypothetical protein